MLGIRCGPMRPRWSSHRRCVPSTVGPWSFWGWSKCNENGKASGTSHHLFWWSMSQHHKAEELRPKQDTLPAWLLRSDCCPEKLAFFKHPKALTASSMWCNTPFPTNRHLWCVASKVYEILKVYLCCHLPAMLVWHRHLVYVCYHTINHHWV